MRSNATIASLFALLLSATVSSPGSASTPACKALDFRMEAVEEALFFALPEGLRSGSHVVETTVFVNGKEARRESLQIPALVAGVAPAVELFALHPKVVSELLAAARALEYDVMLQVVLDGEILVTQPIEEMIQQSLELRGLGFTPLDVVPVSPPDSGGLRRLVAASGASCEDDCWDDFDLCEERCEMRIPTDPECIARCENDRDICLDQCGAPPSCPTVQTFTVPTLISEVWQGFTKCLQDHFFPLSGGKEYDRVFRTFKLTEYRQTTHCDGSVTTEVIGVTHSSDLCWVRRTIPCSPITSSQGLFICP